jgi:quercetin dioxygenase-like cupin family protein
MSLTVKKGHFDGLSGALEDIREKNLFPTTYATDHATAANLHWHGEDVLVYLVKGRTYFLDADGGEHQLEAGDLITVPAGTLHAEGAVNEPVVMLIGLVEAVPMDQFLVQRTPDELKQ